jgi:hypothetical protein
MCWPAVNEGRKKPPTKEIPKRPDKCEAAPQLLSPAAKRLRSTRALQRL